MSDEMLEDREATTSGLNRSVFLKVVGASTEGTEDVTVC